LTIIQRIVELYGGTVWIDGARGPGCTVQFTIPSFQKQEEASNATKRSLKDLVVVNVVRQGAL
jgi:hypothetical protein